MWVHTSVTGTHVHRRLLHKCDGRTCSGHLSSPEKPENHSSQARQLLTSLGTSPPKQRAGETLSLGFPLKDKNH